MDGDNLTTIIVAVVVTSPLWLAQLVMLRRTRSTGEVVEQIHYRVIAIDEAVNTVPKGTATISERVDATKAEVTRLGDQEAARVTERAED